MDGSYMYVFVVKVNWMDVKVVKVVKFVKEL